MRTNLYLVNNILTNSRRRNQEIDHVFRNIGRVKNEVEDEFGDHEWAVVIFNGLHTSRNVGRHSTVFGFVQGGEDFYLQCWAAHILEDGQTQFFFDTSRELLRSQITSIGIVSPDGSVAHTVTYDGDGGITME